MVVVPLGQIVLYDTETVPHNEISILMAEKTLLREALSSLPPLLLHSSRGTARGVHYKPGRVGNTPF